MWKRMEEGQMRTCAIQMLWEISISYRVHGLRQTIRDLERKHVDMLLLTPRVGLMLRSRKVARGSTFLDNIGLVTLHLKIALAFFSACPAAETRLCAYTRSGPL